MAIKEMETLTKEWQKTRSIQDLERYKLSKNVQENKLKVNQSTKHTTIGREPRRGKGGHLN